LKWYEKFVLEIRFFGLYHLITNIFAFLHYVCFYILHDYLYSCFSYLRLCCSLHDSSFSVLISRSFFFSLHLMETYELHMEQL